MDTDLFHPRRADEPDLFADLPRPVFLNVGRVAVPDPRLETSHSFIPTEKIIPASLRVVDIAGIVRGASTGEGVTSATMAPGRPCL